MKENKVVVKCPKCMKREFGEKRSSFLKNKKGKYSIEQIQELLHSRGFKLLSEPLEGEVRDTLEVECETCGKREKLKLSSFIYKDYHCECYKNNFSKGERLVKGALKKEGIEFLQNYRFKDCKSKNPLSFDFYLPKYNCCIEYQGCQHYDRKEHQGLTRRKNRCGGFEELQKRDQIKREYCEGKNILYIELFEY